MSNMKNMMHYITAEAAELNWPGWVLGEAAGNLRAEVVTVDGVVLLPLLKIMTTEEVCITYLKESNMMFIGNQEAAAAQWPHYSPVFQVPWYPL